MAGWIGVDLDGTLAHFDRWRGPRHIGLPIPAMAKRVHDWHARGVEVRIFTARASRPELIPDVQDWLKRHGFPPLAITNQKDFGMVELWDDRAIQVLYNTGKAVRPNHLQEIEKAELFDPDEEVVYVDDGESKREIVPTAEEVEKFKRNIKASSDESLDSLDDLLDALDDGDYTPGDSSQTNALATPLGPPSVASLADDEGGQLPEDSIGFVNGDAQELPRPNRAMVEIELEPGDTSRDDETIPALSAIVGQETTEIPELSGALEEEMHPIDAGTLDDTDELPAITRDERAAQIADDTEALEQLESKDKDAALDKTLDEQPLGAAASLNDFEDLDNDLDSALDDVPDDLRSPSVNENHEPPKANVPPVIRALPEDDLDDYLDDLPAFRVERR
ncbi:MAG: hypothetical protein ACPGSC_04695 [Granulosicoccaceae bacterium]